MANSSKSQGSKSKKKPADAASSPAEASKMQRPLSFRDTTKRIEAEARRGHDWHARYIAALVFSARKSAGDPLTADPTELLKVFKPSGAELKKRGLPPDYFDEKMRDFCSNNTVLFMADFAFEVDFTAEAKRKRPQQQKKPKS